MEGMGDFQVSPEAIKEVIETVADDDFFAKVAEDVAVIAIEGSEQLKQAIWAMAGVLMLSDGDMDEREEALFMTIGKAFGFSVDD